MKPTMLLLAALLVAAAPARAQVNLFVDDCGQGPQVTTVRNDCDRNTGAAFSLVGSAVIPTVTRTGFIGSEAILDVDPPYYSYNPGPAPDWWRFDTCRLGALSLMAFPGIAASCPSLWDDVVPAGSSVWAQWSPAVPGRVRLRIAAVLTSDAAYDLVGDGATELAVFRLTVSNAKTIGAGACAGCSGQHQLVLEEINLQTLTDTPDTYLRLTYPLVQFRVFYTGETPVPVRNRTWGAIKSLYR